MKKVELIKLCKLFFFLCEEKGYSFYIKNDKAVFDSDGFRVEYYEERYSEDGYIDLVNNKNQSFSLIELCHIAAGLNLNSDVDVVASSFYTNYEAILSNFEYIYKSYHQRFDDYFPNSEDQLVELQKQWQKEVQKSVMINS